MDSTNQYHAIPIGEQQTAFQSASPMKSIRSFGSGGMVQVVGLVVLVALTAFVSAQVTATRIENRGIAGRVSTFGLPTPARANFPTQKLSATPFLQQADFHTIVKGYVDDICFSIKHTACYDNSARDTDWCKICGAYM